jgi:uncharacterized membrane protein YdbT with pleckstrin-like domain
MNDDQPPVEDYSRPVAYDVNGQPLYAHPADVATDPKAPMSVHVSRPADPQAAVIDDATKLKHDESRRHYPALNLSASEYVIMEVRRHPIGLIVPFILGVFLVSLSFAVLFNYDFVARTLGLTGAAADPATVFMPLLLFILLICLGIYIAYSVYTNNRFYLTNESVIQDIQMSLFHRREQTISLGSVEDASFVQDGLIQELVDYGTIRLSTVGDEDTYTFPFVGKPKEHIAVLNDAVESFKNGRPVTDDR